MGCCMGGSGKARRLQHRSLQKESDRLAAELHVGTNMQVLIHQLNNSAEREREAKDPRSFEQRQQADALLQTLMTRESLEDEGRPKLTKDGTIGFTATVTPNGGLATMLKRSDTRTDFILNRTDATDWSMLELIVSCGPRNLEVCEVSLGDVEVPFVPPTSIVGRVLPVQKMHGPRHVPTDVQTQSSASSSGPWAGVISGVLGIENSAKKEDQDEEEPSNLYLQAVVPEFHTGSIQVATPHGVAISAAVPPEMPVGAAFLVQCTADALSLTPPPEKLGVRLAAKHIAAMPSTQRWRFQPVDKDAQERNPSDCWWFIRSVAFPTHALTVETCKKQEPLYVVKWNPQDERQMFQYDEHQRLLCKCDQDLAVWNSMKFDDASCQDTKNEKVMLVPRNKAKYTYESKTIHFTNKKGKPSTKTKSIKKLAGFDDFSRLLKWAILPEHYSLSLVPRLLRTTHAHSPYFRMTGERARQLEIEKGPEKWCCDALGDRLVAYSPLLPFILGASVGHWQEDKFWALCQLLGCPLVDRTETLYCPLKLKVLHPIPKMRANFNMALPEIMEKRARVILDTYSNQEIHILWSGGIDTTAVVVAFSKVADSVDKQQIKIRYCERSVGEYPMFFSRFIKNEFKSEVIEGHVRDVFKPGIRVVTGDPADMLMGTYLMGNAFLGENIQNEPNPLSFALEKPWEEIIPMWLEVRGLLGPKVTSWKHLDPKKMAKKKSVIGWLRWMRPFVEAAPIPIITTFDWMWWVTYACKYQHDLMRIFYNRDEITPELVTSCVNFYQTEEFDQWSFHNHKHKMEDKKVWATYKMPLKNYIMDYTGDPTYRAYKLKVMSVRNSWGYELAIDENWNVIRFGNFSISLRRLTEKYGDRLDRFIYPQASEAREKIRAAGADPMLVGCTALAAASGFTLAALVLCAPDPFTIVGHHDIQPGSPIDGTQAELYDPNAAGQRAAGGGGGCGGGGE